jgi:hypothetical protein
MAAGPTSPNPGASSSSARLLDYNGPHGRSNCTTPPLTVDRRKSTARTQAVRKALLVNCDSSFCCWNSTYVADCVSTMLRRYPPTVSSRGDRSRLVALCEAGWRADDRDRSPEAGGV